MYKRLDEFLAKNEMYPANIVRYWLRTGVIKLEDVCRPLNEDANNFDELEALASEFHESVVYPKKETLCQIKPGMFWYEDNVFSFDLIAGKQVKSVVLAVVGNAIYGDTFRERKMKWHEATNYISNFVAKYVKKGEACWYSLEFLEGIRKNETAITQSLVKIGQSRWIGSYWTNVEVASNYAKMMDVSDGESIVDLRERNYRVRPVIKMIV